MEINKITSAYGAKPYESFAAGSKQSAPEKSVALQGAPEKKAAIQQGTPEKSAANPKEQLELSSTSQSLMKVKEAINKLPEVRLPIVDEIRTKIKYNGYPVESNLYKYIERIVENELKNPF
ncbi:MAG: hypothetical protein Q4F84_02250 [Fibrobacter sp.]|nr:hypothetical protein [Fibrobacter sp.]